MTPEIEAAVIAGAARGEDADQALRHHLLEGLLRRLAASPVAGDFVLRGGLLTRLWSPGRCTTDLDLVGDYPFDVDATSARLRAMARMPVDDGLQVDASAVRTRGIWLDTDFPGVRAQIPMGFGPNVFVVSADVGFGDPLVPPAHWEEVPTLIGETPRLRLCHPACQAAWKLHGLAECGAKFRPKDLADLDRTVAAQALSVDDLAPAVVAAFTSREFTVQQALDILDAPFWATRRAAARWASTGAPGDLAETLARVRRVLAPTFARLTETH